MMIGNHMNTENIKKCHCHTCRPIDAADPESVYMRLCLNCGNKRCPKATDHNNECSGSNAVGQIGSIYGVVDVYSEKPVLQ
jgi:hypothetical protein